MALQLSALADRGTITIVKVGNGSHSQVPGALLKVEDARMRLWGETQKDNVFLIQTRQSMSSLLWSNLSAAISSLTLRSIAGLVGSLHSIWRGYMAVSPHAASLPRGPSTATVIHASCMKNQNQIIQVTCPSS